MITRVDFFRHALTAADAEAMARVLTTPFLTSGPECRQVEAQLRDFFGVPHAFMTNSWTNGAVAGLLALGVGAGDEVIVPAQTFIATANVVELVGARPVFVDVDPTTLLMTPEHAAAAVTARTRAVIPVHLYGQMCDVRGLRAILPPTVAIIEDCAHAFESTRDGYLPGAHADMAIFSFYATKNVTCGEGGAVVTRREDLVDRLSATRLHGMSKGAADRFSGGRYNHWDMAVLGTKANLPDVLAALLPRQIATVRERLPQRQAMAQRYRAAFQGTPVRLVGQQPGCSTAEHLFPIAVPPDVRDDAIAALNGAGIGVTVNYRSVPTATYYRQKYGYDASTYPVSFDWGEGTLSLPLFPGLSEEEQGYVIDTVHERIVPMCLARAAGR